MKKLVIASTIVLISATAAYAADDKSTDKQDGMMKNCQHHMKDGKMMDTMPKHMMEQCHGMMKHNGMKDMKSSNSEKPDTADDYKNNHGK